MTTILAPARLLGDDRGETPYLPPEHLIELVRAAGLTGHGGAGFPTATKLAAVRAATGAGTAASAAAAGTAASTAAAGTAGGRRGRRAVVVGNGAEGEPASAKDKALLWHAPHLVLDGLQVAAAAVGAGRAYLYVVGTLADRLQPLVAARATSGRDRVPVQVHRAPDGFVSGEESAVVAAINGRPARPADKFRRVTEHGVAGAPTLVQNVETLAHLALIARHGAHWFRRAGTPQEPGTFLATVSGAVTVPGVYELPYGVPLGELLAAAGGPAEPVQAVLVGGFHGAWVPAAFELPVSRAGLAAYGGSPGAGVVIALGAGRCGLTETARIVAYLARESANQCGPCRNGLPRLATTMAALAGAAGATSPPARAANLRAVGTSGPDPHADIAGRPAGAANLRAVGTRRPDQDAGLVDAVGRLAALVEGRGACAHPDGTVRLVRSAMVRFADDVRAHLAGGCLMSGGPR